MDTGTRVALRSAEEWTGTVKGTPSGGQAFIQFDNGHSGSYPTSSLVRLQDKAWPPGDLETKTPRTEHK